MLVDYDNYKDQDFTCKHCGWQGKGNKLGHGDFSELHFIGNLDCPKCFELVAFWQATLITPQNEAKEN